MPRRLAAIASLVLAAILNAQPQSDASSSPPTGPGKSKVVKTILAGELTEREWTIDGTKRVALLHVPENVIKPKEPEQKPSPGGTAPSVETTAPSAMSVPVVFAFHGHGGGARQAALSFHLHKEWPEALVVYMQGLPTPSVRVDPEGKKNGWQNVEGQQGDRDLRFFDAVLTTLKGEYAIDASRVYATGHSNGGGFTYLLWRARPDAFAAFAPSAAGGARLGKLAAKPAMHIAGRNDELVRFAMQEKNIEAIKKANACDEKGLKWAENCTLFTSKSGTPFVAYIHDGTHKYPAEAPALIVKFFKEHGKAVVRPTDGAPTEPVQKK